MAETTGLLNRRTGHSVPRVRISSSPQGKKRCSPARKRRAVFRFVLPRARSRRNKTKTAPRPFGRAGLHRSTILARSPPGGHRDSASSASCAAESRSFLFHRTFVAPNVLRLQVQVPVIDHFNIACGILELARIDHALPSNRSMNPSGKFFQRVFKGRRVCLG